MKPSKATIRAALPALALSATLTACSENERMEYALDDRVYFHETETLLATENVVTQRNYSFALQPSARMEDTLRIAVRLMGRLSDHDRAFRAVAVADSSTAQSPLHYELLDGVLPAGAYMGYLPVVIKRTPDTQDRSVALCLRLTDSGELGTGPASALTFRLSWGDMLLKPDHWPYFFGTYSTNKYRFAIDVLGVTDWPQATRFNNGSEEGLYTAAQLQVFAAQLNEAYAEYRKTHAPIYTDDDADEKVEIHFSANS